MAPCYKTKYNLNGLYIIDMENSIFHEPWVIIDRSPIVSVCVWVFAIFMCVNIFLSALSAFTPGDQCIHTSAGKLTVREWQQH